MSTPNVTTEPVLEALRVKHALGLARPSMARVINEALREYRQRREQEQGQ